MENLNAVFIAEGIPQAKRLSKLNAIAISQMKLLTEDHRVAELEQVKNKDMDTAHTGKHLSTIQSN